MDDIPNIDNLANRDEILTFILERCDGQAYARVLLEALDLLKAFGAQFFLTEDNPNAFLVEMDPTRFSD